MRKMNLRSYYSIHYRYNLMKLIIISWIYQVIGGHLDPAVDPGGLADIDFKLVAGGGTNLR